MTIREKSVPVTLSDGVERHLLLDYNALAELMDLLKVEITDLRVAMTGPGSLKAIRAILWAGFLHEDDTLTPKKIGALIDPMKIGELAVPIAKALGLAFGGDGEPKNAAPPAETPAT
jgi:hypothetical protein